jgi:long-subunit fatty acid transport protein
MRRVITSAILFCVFQIPIFLSAQDNPFVWGHAWGVGARAVAMGGAYTAVSDDYSSIYYNPAGMGQIRKTCLSGSLSFLSMENKATFLGVQTGETPTYTRLNDLGLCLPISVSRGSLAFGIGYHRTRLFDNGMLTSNDVQFSPSQFPPDGYQARWENQRIEEGTISNTSIGASVEMGPGLFVGAGIHIWGGDDDYTWQFREIDEKNLYTYSDSTSTEHIATDFSGINLSLGVLLKVTNSVNFGATVVTPVTLRGRENWDYADVFTWDADQGKSPETLSDNGNSEYKIQSPWILRGGLAVRPGPLLVSAEGELVNYSQIEYTTDPPQSGYTRTQANMDIKRDFQNVLNTKVGAELDLPFAKGKLRAGYAMYPSHLKNAGSNQTRKVVSFGAGFRFNDQLVLDVAVAMTSWTPPSYDTSVFNRNYSIQEKINARNIFLTFSYLM